MDSVGGWEDLRDAMKKGGIAIIDAFTRRDFEDIGSGLNCFTSLDQAKASCDYFSCQVSRSEMHHVILAAKAEDELIRQRVSKSLRSKRPLLLYRAILDNTDYVQIQEQLRDFFDTLYEEHGINIQIIEKSEHGPTATSVLHTAEVVWSHLLTETMDGYIYAAALECRADYFITADANLRQAANDLRQTSGEWANVAQALREALGNPADFKFPEGVPLRHRLA